ncbi:LysE family translocator [Lysinibacillus sp. NPDC097231]|uniref:LysE family translocator n=1 Tax=Lysinibacillus sp. NPDC097231 TaxID=3364142 RepID=UPI0038245C76
MLTNIILFSITSFLLIIVPGPDTAIITRNTIVHKKGGGFRTLIGTLFAISVHTIAAIVGLSTIILQSAFIFTIFKYVGAAYLIYLGIKSLYSIKKHNNSLKHEIVELQDSAQNNEKSLMLQGFLANISNPKVAIFFLTFFPQFVNPQTDTTISFLILGVVYLFIKFAWFALFIYIIDSVRLWMKKGAVKKAMDGLTGVVFIVFGLRLALEHR